MHRRSFLRAGLVSTGIALAGCLGGDDETVLDPPDREYDVDPEALAYPAYGQELPDATLPSPLHDRELSTRTYVGERETLMTFVFTRCQGPCPVLTASLARAQLAASEDGYADEVVFMPTTFDPEHDTEERIREFSEENGADPTEENWQFLRPRTPERAQSVIASSDGFGVAFDEVPVEESDHSDHGGHETEEGETTFIHSVLLLLANRDGYVERAYTPQPPSPAELVDDLEAVREGYE